MNKSTNPINLIAEGYGQKQAKPTPQPDSVTLSSEQYEAFKRMESEMTAIKAELSKYK